VIVVKCRQKFARVAAVLHTGGVPLTEELIAESRRLRRQLSILRRELERVQALYEALGNEPDSLVEQLKPESEP